MIKGYRRLRSEKSRLRLTTRKLMSRLLTKSWKLQLRGRLRKRR